MSTIQFNQRLRLLEITDTLNASKGAVYGPCKMGFMVCTIERKGQVSMRAIIVRPWSPDDSSRTQDDAIKNARSIHWWLCLPTSKFFAWQNQYIRSILAIERIHVGWYALLYQPQTGDPVTGEPESFFMAYTKSFPHHRVSQTTRHTIESWS